MNGQPCQLTWAPELTTRKRLSMFRWHLQLKGPNTVLIYFLYTVHTKHLKQGDPKHALSWESIYLGIQEGTLLLYNQRSDRAFRVSQWDQCQVFNLITLIVNQWIVESSQTSGYEQLSFCVIHALTRSPCNAGVCLIAVKQLRPISGLLESTFPA